MNRISPVVVVAAAALAAVSGPCFGQTLQQRMDRVRDQQRDAEVAKARELAESKTGQFLVSQVRTGGGVMEVPAKQAFEFIAVASGEKTKSELNGVGEEEFAPWSIGPTL